MLMVVCFGLAAAGAAGLAGVVAMISRLPLNNVVLRPQNSALRNGLLGNTP
jgi:hypothetical protein